MSLNVVSIAGRLVRDPEIVPNKKGKTVLFTLAVERGYKDADGNRPVDFIPVKAFVREGAKSNGPYDHMVKGQIIAVKAELRATQFEKVSTDSMLWYQTTVFHCMTAQHQLKLPNNKLKVN